MYFEQFIKQIKTKLSPVYFIASDEPYLLRESRQLLALATKQKGYTEHEVIDVTTSFDWPGFISNLSQGSLFSQKRYVELRLIKLDDKGRKALLGYIESPAPDIILTITIETLDSSLRKSAFFKKMDKGAVVVQLWPLDRGKFISWLESKLKEANIFSSSSHSTAQSSPSEVPSHGGIGRSNQGKVAKECLPDIKTNPRPSSYSDFTDVSKISQLIAARTEGNMLAASQEIEKLSLLALSGPLDEKTIINAVTNSSRYSIFDLADSCLAKNPMRVNKIFDVLKEEGAEPILILWALTQDIRLLANIKYEIDQGKPVGMAMKSQYVFPKRQSLVSQYAQNARLKKLYDQLQQACHIDQVIKGVQPGNPWEKLLGLAVSIST